MRREGTEQKNTERQEVSDSVYVCSLYFKKVPSLDENLYPWTKVKDGRNEG